MPNKRDIKLDDYEISKWAYRELYNWCLQYPEKKQRLSELRNSLKSTLISDMPHSSTTGDTTASAAVRAAKLSADTELIEQTATRVLPDAYQELIKAVTDGTYRFKPYGRIGWADFFNARRNFFYLLNKTLDKGRDLTYI